MNHLSITLGGTMTKSKAALEQVIMPVPEEAIDYLDYTFDEMHTYSDLDYLYYELSLGFVYTFYQGFQWTVEGTYYNLDDETGYVYGNETGTLFQIRSGIKMDF